MSKVKSAFFCQQCGFESAKWLGKCPACQQWNSFVEEIKHKDTKPVANKWQQDNHAASGIVKLQDITTIDERRVITPDAELNRVLGGGIVPGSIVLIAGEPGIGKSTLLLQIGLQLKDHI